MTTPPSRTRKSAGLSGEVDMTGGIDDIDEVVFPLSRYSRGNDGNTAFPLLGHPVGNSRAVIDIANS